MGTIMGILIAWAIVSILSLISGIVQKARLRRRLRRERRGSAESRDKLVQQISQLQTDAIVSEKLKADLIKRNREQAMKHEDLIRDYEGIRIKLAVYENRFPNHYKLIEAELEQAVGR